MQILDGTLVVEVIKGSRGEFCVGTLKTSIGEFKVKDAALEEFDRGTYNGRFTIEKIYIESSRWRGGWFTNLMAKVTRDGYLIDEKDLTPAPAPSVQAEPDPIDEQAASAAVARPVATPKPEKPATRPAVALADDDDDSLYVDPDEKLFGVELYPLFRQRAPVIALDNTIDREQFRQQRDRLKANGYRFDPKTQQWQWGA